MNQVVLHDGYEFGDGISIASRPLDTDVGIRPLNPFVLSVRVKTSNYNDIKVDLYAQNSRSIPYTKRLDNNWAALKPTWEFTDVNGDRIEEQMDIVYTSEVVDEDGILVGAIGSVTFYYTDSLASRAGSPVIIWATLNALKYHDIGYNSESSELEAMYNSKMRTAIPFYIYPTKPQFLHFSTNGVFALHDIQWTGSPVNAFATIHGIPRSQYTLPCMDAVDYPIIFDAPLFAPSGDLNVLDYTIPPLTGAEIEGVYDILSVDFPEFELRSGVSTGGWVEVDITPLVMSDSAILSGTMSIAYDNTDYNFFHGNGDGNGGASSQMWVSNMLSNRLHALQYNIIDTSLPTLSAFYANASDEIDANLHGTAFCVPYYEESYYDVLLDQDILSNVNELSGQSGIYGIAIDGKYNVWCADFELDRIYKRDPAGLVLKTVDLRTLLHTGDIPSPYANNEYTWYGPNTIAIDGHNDVYVTLWNSPSAMKMDEDGEVLYYLTPSGTDMTPPPASGSELSYIRPIDVHTGVMNDVHILYAGDYKNIIVHYDSTGVETGSLVLNQDGAKLFNMVYVGDSDSGQVYITRRGGRGLPNTPTPNITKYDFDGTSYSNPEVILDVPYPVYITADINNNLWFGYDGGKIGVLTDRFTPNQTEFLSYTLPCGGNDRLTLLGGLECDNSGFVNALDAYNNKIYRFDANAFVSSEGVGYNPCVVKILPEDNYTVVNDSGYIEGILADEDDHGIWSLQAYGDWTGRGWIRKYGESDGGGDSNIETLDLRGGSSAFAIRSYSKDYELRRFNDSWDMHAQIRSYILPDFQKQFTNLWDDLIGNSVGDASSEYQTFGRQFYEKISNFVLNHVDIDLANIEQLYSILDSFKYDYDTFASNYPPDLHRWMNILSISFERLKGTQHQCNRNFQHERFAKYTPCTVCGVIHDTNMGEAIPLSGGMVISEAIVIKDKYMGDDGYDVFYPPISGSFDQLSGYGYRDGFRCNYEPYEYIPTVSPNDQAAGHINWIDEYNTLDISGISATDWWKDGGYVEEIFSQTLYSGLEVDIGIITLEEAQNTYNINSFGKFDDDETTILIDNADVDSVFIAPIKCSINSPIATWGVAVYTTNATITGPVVPITPTNHITDGVISSSRYGKINIGGTLYYTPLYDIDTVLIPIIGDGVTLEEGTVVPNFTLTNAGFLVMDDGVNTLLLPLYK